jgi:cholest-4-en-3-one 26-monooxygenase
VIAICELLGVPVEDRSKIAGWSNAMVGMDDPEYADDPSGGPLAAMQLAMYAQELGERRRADPRDDIVTELLNAEVDGERLTAAEFNAFVLILAVAGNETTRNLISAGLWLLCEHPEERARVQADLGILPTAIDEMLRYHPPVLYFRRTAMRDVELRGERIREGDKVSLWYVLREPRRRGLSRRRPVRCPADAERPPVVRLRARTSPLARRSPTRRRA